MDFSRVALADDDRTFQHELRALLAELVTADVIRRDRETGENFDENVHLALGAAGHLESDWKTEDEGGFSAVRKRIWELEIARAHTPWFHWGTTSMVARAVAQFASAELADEVLPGTLAGRLRLCLGYTEPEGGSDIATCQTRAVQDGDHWVINGSKMFTSNAHNAQYVFLITNTDPNGRKHRNLTMFLVPMDLPGVEVQGIRTIDGDRTNITYYSDVRVSDRYRIGEVNGGWTVLRGALDKEHGTHERDGGGLQSIAVMSEHLNVMAEAVDRIAAVVDTADDDGRRLLDDDSVKQRLGMGFARVEAAMSATEAYGRVAIAQTMRDAAPDLMDVLGTAASLPAGADGAVDDGGMEYVYRLAGPTGVYAGTLEVFKNMIAQHALGLGRPNYSAPAGR